VRTEESDLLPELAIVKEIENRFQVTIPRTTKNETRFYYLILEDSATNDTAFLPIVSYELLLVAMKVLVIINNSAILEL